MPSYRLVPFIHTSSIAEAHEILASDLGEDCITRVEPDPATQRYRTFWLNGPPSIEPHSAVYMTTAYAHLHASEPEYSSDESTQDNHQPATIDVEHTPPITPPDQPPEPSLDQTDK